MKRLVFIIFLISFSFIPDSCKKEHPCACGEEHPENNLPWLVTLLSQTSYANVYKVDVGDVEYIACTTVAGQDAVSLVFDCSGILICKAGQRYTGENNCNFLSSSWDSIYQKRELIYEKRE